MVWQDSRGQQQQRHILTHKQLEGDPTGVQGKRGKGSLQEMPSTFSIHLCYFYILAQRFLAANKAS